MDLLHEEMARKRKAVNELKRSFKSSNKHNTKSSTFIIKASKLRELEEQQDESLSRVKAMSKVREGLKDENKVAKNEKGMNKQGEMLGELGTNPAVPSNFSENNNVSLDSGQCAEKIVGDVKLDGSVNKCTLIHVSGLDHDTTLSVKRERLVKTQLDEDSKYNEYSINNIKKMLRDLGHPIKLFGESDLQIKQRLTDLSARMKQAIGEKNEDYRDEFRLGSGHGIRNPFLEKDDITTTKQSASLGKKIDEGSNEKDNEHKVEENNDDEHKRIYHFFKQLLRQWEDELALRSDYVKRSAKGKNETLTLKQCKDYIRPLFKQCKKRTLGKDIQQAIIKIIDFCQAGEFVKAHDAYMDVAIGRAAWPIGVTMVGIHARSGRERIETGKVAHAMNSELQRKYLTSIKRLMTFCQKKRGDVLPSKKVMN